VPFLAHARYHRENLFKREDFHGFFISTNPAKAGTTIQKNMPRTFYANESEIPADQKGCYENKNGRWELTKLDTDHPVMITKASLESTQTTLKTQNDSLTAQVGNLEREKTELSGKSVPHGYRAVKKEVAELGEIAVAEGLSTASVKTLKAENDQFKTEKSSSAERELKTRALKAIGIEDVQGFFELKASDNLKIETETVDGKEKFFVILENNGVREKKGFDAEYLKGAEGFKNSFDSLTQKKNETGFSFSEQGGEPGNKNIFDKIRADVKAAEVKPVTDIDSRFGKAA